MIRSTRCQGAILQDHHILLIKHREHASGRSYWLLPGGGMEPGESEEDAVKRASSREETHLEVQVVRVLLDAPAKPGGIYQRFKTFECRILGGEPSPGHEPEEEALSWYAITEVRWFDLRDETSWTPEVFDDPITYPLLGRIQAALGYK